MNEDQIEQLQKLVKELAEKSGTDFDTAFERVLGVARYHAIDVVPWGKTAACGSTPQRDDWRHCQHSDPDKAEPMR